MRRYLINSAVELCPDRVIILDGNASLQSANKSVGHRLPCCQELSSLRFVLERFGLPSRFACHCALHGFVGSVARFVTSANRPRDDAVVLSELAASGRSGDAVLPCRLDVPDPLTLSLRSTRPGKKMQKESGRWRGNRGSGVWPAESTKRGLRELVLFVC